MMRVLYQVPGGWGYDILDDEGRLNVHQPFQPGIGGKMPMSAQEAAAIADAVLATPEIDCPLRSFALAGPPITLTVTLGPEAYDGLVRFYQNGQLLGEVNADDRRAILELKVDAAGALAIRAGNDTYGWAEVVLEAIE